MVLAVTYLTAFPLLVEAVNRRHIHRWVVGLGNPLTTTIQIEAMPIRPENIGRYPADWRTAIVPAVRERSGNCCEGSPAYPDCRAPNGEPHPVTGSKVVLTVAHLEHDDLETRDIERMRHWCQRCHNTYDAKMRAAGIRHRAKLQCATADLFDADKK